MAPPYKGIPIVLSTSIALFKHYNKITPWAFTRKEIKDHGEGGLFVGSEITGKVLILDDVITSGSTISEFIKTINNNKIADIHILVGVDRKDEGCCINKNIYNIITINEINEYLSGVFL